MTQALYSKYRPKVFDDVVGQKHILQTIKNAILTDKISHAYMFCGPRGTGKTTMARLVSKALICQSSTDDKLPSINFCGNCENCIDIANGRHPDVNELDAASRTGVENVREEIINRVNFAATKGSKKVYIIDEVHMLSTAAFNALLKTLEEPPEHVVFILCTTDPQKVPETILSRCQRFDFKSISASDIFDRLKYVCTQENVKASDEALIYIANKASGAMRNALTSLELAIAYSNGDVKIEHVDNTTLGNEYNFAALMQNLYDCDLACCLEYIDKQNNLGCDFSSLSASLIQLVRDMFIVSSGASVNVSIDDKLRLLSQKFDTKILQRYLLILADLSVQLKSSSNHKLDFELAIAKMCVPKIENTIDSLNHRVSMLEKKFCSSSINYEENVSTENNNLKKQRNFCQLSKNPNLKKFDVNNNTIQNDKNVKVNELKQSYNLKINDGDKLTVENFKQANAKAVKSIIKNDLMKDMPNFSSNDNDKAKSNTKSEIKEFKLPQKIPHNILEEREHLKHQAGIETKKENKYDMSKIEDQNKVWDIVVNNMRRKYPAISAMLMTCRNYYNINDKTMHIVLSKSSQVFYKTLIKEENFNIIKDILCEISGYDLQLNIEIKKNEEDFDKEFISDFRKHNDNNNDNVSYQAVEVNSTNLEFNRKSSFANPKVVEPDFIKNKTNKKSSESFLSRESSVQVNNENINSQEKIDNQNTAIKNIHNANNNFIDINKQIFDDKAITNSENYDEKMHNSRVLDILKNQGAINIKEE